MVENPNNLKLFSELDKSLRLYVTVPATAERTSSYYVASHNDESRKTKLTMPYLLRMVKHFSVRV